MKRLALLAALAAAPLALPADALAQAWAVDRAASTLAFEGTQGGRPFRGEFRSWDAEIVFDPADPAAGRAEVTVETGSAATGDAQRDAAIPQADWFATSRFPRAVFRAEGFRHLGGDRYEAAGTLTIRDATAPVTLPFVLAIDGGVARVRGETTILRTDFGVGQGQWATGQIVGLEVKVVVDLVARAAQ
jgi:polyisoprenoid-binding protein YceI